MSPPLPLVENVLHHRLEALAVARSWEPGVLVALEILCVHGPGTTRFAPSFNPIQYALQLDALQAPAVKGVRGEGLGRPA